MTTKRMAYLLLSFSFILMLISNILACSNSKVNPSAALKEKIIGKWKSQSGGENAPMLEIFDNNTFKWSGHMMVSGNWDVLKDGRIQFRGAMGDIAIGKLPNGKLQIEFSGDRYEYYNRHKVYEEAEYKDGIIGTWENNIRGKFIEKQIFNKDMSHLQSVTIPGRGTSGSSMSDKNTSTYYYKFIDKNRIETGGGKTYTIKKLTSDQLILYDEDLSRTKIYKRIS